MTNPITAYIYRSNKKEEMYLYVSNKDDFAQVPEVLMKQFGQPEFAMELELTPQRSLAREDIGKVLDNLDSQGFHLQMPPTTESLLNSLKKPQ